MSVSDKINILLVDDQPAKLLSYQVILEELGENLIIASSGREALECLLKNEISILLIDVCMPDLDGFELASMIREHPRYSRISMIFISAIQVSDIDRLRGYEMGGVDYVPVPVVPEVLRAKVRVFAELHRKTRELEKLNKELEQRVSARTAELQASTAKLIESEQRRSLAIAAGNMGSWDWDWLTGDVLWDEGQYRIFGVERAGFEVSPRAISRSVVAADRRRLADAIRNLSPQARTCEIEFHIRRPDGETRCCFATAAATLDGGGRIQRVSGVTIDITARRRAEQRQMLLAREVDHRARNVLTLVQSMVRLTRAEDVGSFSEAVEGRITALARVHTILSLSSWEGAELGSLAREELSGFIARDGSRVSMNGPHVRLKPAAAQTLALALHELATNALKYGALSTHNGTLSVSWREVGGNLQLDWRESSGPRVSVPTRSGFGTRSVIASVETQLGGSVNFDWRPEGLICRLWIPLRDRAEPVEQEVAAPKSTRVGSLVA
jgi:PAS domain S-box-containing protein